MIGDRTDAPLGIVFIRKYRLEIVSTVYIILDFFDSVKNIVQIFYFQPISVGKGVEFAVVLCYNNNIRTTFTLYTATDLKKQNISCTIITRSRQKVKRCGEKFAKKQKESSRGEAPSTALAKG